MAPSLSHAQGGHGSLPTKNYRDKVLRLKAPSALSFRSISFWGGEVSCFFPQCSFQSGSGWVQLLLAATHGLSRPAGGGIEFLPRHSFLPARLLTGKKGTGACWAAARELHEASGTAGTLAEEPVQLACGKGCLWGCGSKMWEPLLLYPPALPPQPHSWGMASHADLCNGTSSCRAPLVADPLAAAMASSRDSDGEQVVPDEEDEGPDVKAVQARYLRSPSPSR